MLKELVKAGCDVTATDGDWNCLFIWALRANHPEHSHDLEILLYLLDIFPDHLAVDDEDLTVFDHLHDDPYRAMKPGRGSYNRDLWYTALRRSGLETTAEEAARPRKAIYTTTYTPQHYRALCHLQVWNSRKWDPTTKSWTNPMDWTAEMQQLDKLYGPLQVEEGAEWRLTESELSSLNVQMWELVERYTRANPTQAVIEVEGEKEESSENSEYSDEEEKDGEDEDEYEYGEQNEEQDDDDDEMCDHA